MLLFIYLHFFVIQLLNRFWKTKQLVYGIAFIMIYAIEFQPEYVPAFSWIVFSDLKRTSGRMYMGRNMFD